MDELLLTLRTHLFSGLLLTLSSASFAAPTFVIDTAPKITGELTIAAGDLCYVADNTAQYITGHVDDSYAVHDGVIGEQSFPVARVLKTLSFICDTYREDIKNQTTSRLNTLDYLTKHFEFVRWYPDKAKAQQVAEKSTNEVKSRLLNSIPKQQLFLTKYYTKLLSGSETKTSHYSQALYALPFDEQEMSLEEAEQSKATLTRFQYTREQVINGALLDKNLAKPLIWISEEALHDVLLQGTGVLNVGNTIRYFNVHRNNGIAYDYHIGKREQQRYWYFAEVPSILGYGKEINEKIPLKPYVSLAGNVKQIGLGKLILLNYNVNGKPENKLAVLADEGGAFDDNLFQLDYLVGSYHGWADYHQANKQLPDYANAWILLLKE